MKLLSLSLVCLLSVCTSARAEEGVQVMPDVVYGHKDGMALTFDMYRPDEHNGVGLLFMVSGGWYSRWQPPERLQARFQPLLDHGFTVLAVRHGSAPRYKVPEAIDDVRLAVRFVRMHAEQYGVDPDRLGVFGMSAGGHLSLMLASASDEGDPKSKNPVLRQSSRVAAVVAYFGPSDLRPWVIDHLADMPNRYPALQFETELADDCSPLVHATADDAPTLMIHGDQDTLVPLDHSLDMLSAWQKADATCELMTIEGAAHGFRDADGDRASKAMIGWFQKYLVDE